MAATTTRVCSGRSSRTSATRLLDGSDRRAQLTDSDAEPELDGTETPAVDLSGDLRRLMAVDRGHPTAELEDLLNAHWIAVR